MKKGLTYIDERNSQLRYSDNNSDVKWIQPLSEYTPLCKIKRGQPVSIANSDDLSEAETTLGLTSGALVNNSITYVTLTNPERHEHCVGLASEYTVGCTVTNTTPNKIHIAKSGEFKFDYYAKTSSLLASGESVIDKEYFPSFLSDYASNIGKTVFVSGSEAGTLTVDKEDSYLAYSNIIQIGHVADAGTSTSPIGAVELQIEGDSRGPIDNTQIEAVLGEEVDLTTANPTKLFALGVNDDSKFKFCINYRQGNVEVPTEGFIGLQRQDGQTGIIYINSTNHTNYTDNDEAFFNIAYAYGSYSGAIPAANIKTITITDDTTPASLITSLTTAVNSLIGNIAYTGVNGVIASLNPDSTANYTAVSSMTVVPNYTDDAKGVGATFEANQPGGYYEMFVSSELVNLLPKSVTMCHGSYYNKGYAILADIRNLDRQNILGLYCSKTITEDTILNRGDSAIFMKQGLLETTNEVFTVGQVYYLGSHGNLYPIPQEYYESVVKVGTAQSTTKLVVDCNDSRRYNNGDLPVGYMKPSIKGEAEYGFLLMDGGAHLKESYPVLYERLLEWYDASDLVATTDDVDEAGHTIDDPDNYFTLPEVKYAAFDTTDNNTEDYYPAQIKAITGGVYKELPREPFLRKFFTYTTADSSDDSYETDHTTIPDIDITGLITTGPEENRIIAPELENIEVKLFADLDWNNEDNDHTVHNWTEIDPGFNTWNEEYFGYKWKVVKVTDVDVTEPYGKWVLRAVLSGDEATEGNGICYQATPFSPPLDLNGLPGKIFIVRHEHYSRQFDMEALYRDIIKEYVLDVDGNPWTKVAISGKAVVDYIRKHVITNYLSVGYDSESTEEDVSDDSGNYSGVVKESLKSASIKAADTTSEDSPNVVVEANMRFYDPNTKNQTIALDYYDALLKYVMSDTLKTTFEATLESNDGTLMPYFVFSTHKHLLIDNANPTLAETYTDADTYPHGIINKGYEGNLDAYRLQGVHIGQPGQLMAGNANGAYTTTTESYLIPVMAYNTTTSQYSEALPATTTRRFGVNDVLKEEVDSSGNLTLTLNGISDVGLTLLPKTTTGVESTKMTIVPDFTDSTLAFRSVNTSNEEGFITVQCHIDEGSSIAYKFLYKEFINDYVDGLSTGVDLASDASTDADATAIKQNAMQAVYELPLAMFRYKNRNAETKKFFGIITERVAGAANSFDASSRGTTSLPIDSDVTTDAATKFTYASDEAASIKEYLKMLTNDDEKAQNILSSIGLLAEAAKETQERLLKVETSTYGLDAPTLPGHVTNYNLDSTTKDYVEGLNQEPLTYGLTRIVKALCREIFQNINPTGELIKNADGSDDASDNYTRIDVLDEEVNGTGAVATTPTRIALDSTLGTTYPADESTAEGADFDGLNNAVNRVARKLNALTEAVNGSDSSNPSSGLDEIRNNIASLIKELYNVTYTTGGTFPVSNSRVDALADKLFNFSVKATSVDQEYNETKINGTIANSVISSSEPTIDDYTSYATIIDLIIDKLCGTTANLSKSTTSTDRAYNSIMTRVASIESILDKLATRVGAVTKFESIVSKSYTNIGSLDELMSIISGYLGITYSNKAWSNVDLTDTIAENNVAFASSSTNMKGIVYDIVARLKKNEYDDKQVVAALGDYAFTNADLDKTEDNITQAASTVYSGEKYKNDYTISTDIYALLKTLFNTDGTKVNHFTTTYDVDAVESSSVLDYLFGSVYALPNMYDDSGEALTGVQTTDTTVLFDFDTASRTVDKSSGSWLNATNKATALTGLDTTAATRRYTRFDAIEQSIKAIRAELGLSAMTSIGRLSGTLSVEKDTPSGTYKINGTDYYLSDLTQATSLMNFVMSPVYDIARLKEQFVDSTNTAVDYATSLKILTGNVANDKTINTSSSKDSVTTISDSRDANDTDYVTYDTLVNSLSDASGSLQTTIRNQAANDAKIEVLKSYLESTSFKLYYSTCGYILLSNGNYYKCGVSTDEGFVSCVLNTTWGDGSWYDVTFKDSTDNIAMTIRLQSSGTTPTGTLIAYTNIHQQPLTLPESITFTDAYTMTTSSDIADGLGNILYTVNKANATIYTGSSTDVTEFRSNFKNVTLFKAHSVNGTAGLTFDFTSTDADTYATTMNLPQITVTYNLNGHGDTSSATFYEGVMKELLQPEAAGYTFLGWADSVNRETIGVVDSDFAFNYGEGYYANNAVTLTAIWG